MAARAAAIHLLRRPIWRMGRAPSGKKFSPHQPTFAYRSSPIVSPSTSHSPWTFLSPQFSSSAASGSSRVINLRDDAHYNEVMEGVGKQGIAVVYYTAQWCGPCKQIAPQVDDLSEKYEDMTFIKFDVDKVELEASMKNSDLSVVPTFHFYLDGNFSGKLTGAAYNKLSDMIVKMRNKKSSGTSKG